MMSMNTPVVCSVLSRVCYQFNQTQSIKGTVCKVAQRFDVLVRHAIHSATQIRLVHEVVPLNLKLER
jgi:hypothetical protein